MIDSTGGPIQRRLAASWALADRLATLGLDRPECVNVRWLATQREANLRESWEIRHAAGERPPAPADEPRLLYYTSLSDCLERLGLLGR